MAPTPEEVLKLAALLSQTIQNRRPEVQTAVRYFRGEEGRLRFASEEFRDYFARRFVGLSDNWCMAVAQPPIERIRHLGVRLATDAPVSGPKRWQADPLSEATWERNDAHRMLSEAVLMMTIAKRSFGLVSQAPDGSRITFENPDSAAVVYDGATRKRKAGMTIWADDTAEYGEILLPGSVLRVKRDKVAIAAGERYVPPDASGWYFNDAQGAIETPHPFGVVPLVEMRNQSLLDNDPVSDIGLVQPMQDSINLVWAYTLNALDFMSLPGRVILNGEHPKEDILDEHGVKIGERDLPLDALVRDRVAWLEGTGLSIGEWSKASIDGFKEIIDLAVAHIAAQTRTPAHYLLSSSANVPATGYELAEAGLVEKALERRGFVDNPVKEIHRLAAIADGDTVRAERIAAGKVLWAKPQYRSEAQLMDGLQKMSAIGFPLRWIAEEYGLEPDEVERVVQMAQDESANPYFPKVSPAAPAAPVAPSAPVAAPAGA